ncbi:Glycosyltransferase family 92 protein [Lachnellula subtilissima]|uniref:Glycosyltransferase family 92 protein n=1 Tax=Lachnellula subtilissima TaxID=602034 RepID=A0A8H8UD23_9HELO|nr:Glycosyltransferase family 92 protein [Lachnellula subtilissima]
MEITASDGAMRTLLNSIQSLNWRLIWVGTFVFMGLYFVAFDKQPLTTEQIQEIQKELPLGIETANQAPKAISVPKMNVRIEDPNPVLGTKWDSPLDAIPGRLTPEENEKLRADANAPKIHDQDVDEGETKQTQDKAKSEKPEDEVEAEELNQSKLDKEKPKGDELKDNKSKEAKPQATTKEGDVKPSQATSENENIKEEIDEDKPKDENSTSERPKEAPKEKGPDIDIGEESKGGQLEENKSKAPTDDKSNPENHKGEQKETKEQVPSEKADAKAQAEKETDPQKADEEQNVEADEATALDKPVPPADYVAFCVAVKNQAIDLPEFFIHHYHHIGIQRFYIMDDRSEKPLSTALEDYGIPEQYITFESQAPYDRTGNQTEQISIYKRCHQLHGSKHTWMAFIDIDEFIEMTAGNETLQDLLHEFEKHEDIGALAVNWRMHTSSGLETRPESNRKAFVDCIWDDSEHVGRDSHNKHVKSIVRMSKAVNPTGPHSWYLSDGAKTVGEHMDPVTTVAYRCPITRNRIALHHYAGKSRQEYEEKMLRGNAMDDPKTEDFWNSLEHVVPQVPCPEMAKYDP